MSVRVQFELGEELDDARVWTCLARTADTVMVSSCRSVIGARGAGSAQVYPGIYYVNKVPIVPETRYVVSFITSGDILRPRRLYPPIDMKETELTPRIVARTRLEYLWSWDPIP